jgi:hypothetical protein
MKNSGEKNLEYPLARSDLKRRTLEKRILNIHLLEVISNEELWRKES